MSASIFSYFDILFDDSGQRIERAVALKVRTSRMNIVPNSCDFSGYV